MKFKEKGIWSKISIIIVATVVLIAVMLTSLVLVGTGIYKSEREYGFSYLEETTAKTSKDLIKQIENSEQHLGTLANAIALQDSLTSDTTLTIMKSFNGGELMPDVGLLFPNNSVLLSDGEYYDASSVVSFQDESTKGVHVSSSSVSLRNPNSRVVRIFVPIEQNGILTAIVYGVVDLKVVENTFEIDAYGGEVQFYIVDGSTGQFIIDTLHEDAGSYNIEILRDRKMAKKYSADKAIEDIKGGKSGRICFRSDTANENFYMEYQPTGINKWQTMLSVPESLIMKRTKDMRNIILVMCIICTLAILGYIICMQMMYKGFVDVFVNTPAGLCVLSADESLTVLHANKTFYSLMNFDESAFKRQKHPSIFELLGSEEQELLRKQYKDIVAKKGQQMKFEFPIRVSPDDVRTLLITTYYNSANQNEINVSAVDVTLRKEMEVQLNLLKQEYQIAVELSDRQVVLYDLKNQTLEQMANSAPLLPFDGVKDFSSVIASSYINNGTLIADECAGEYEDLLCKIHRGDKSGHAYLKMRVQKSDEYRWYSVDFENVFSPEREPLIAVITLDDVTEQHDAETAYKLFMHSMEEDGSNMYQSYERNLTKNSVESMSGAAFQSDEANLTGKDYDAIENAIQLHICDEYKDSFTKFVNRDRLLEAYARGLKSDSMEVRIEMKDGSIRWFKASVQMLKDSYNGDIKAFYTFRNIEEQKNAEEKNQSNVESLQTELKNSRIKIMINQMQPHFLYNALSAIQTIIKIDPDYAYHLVYDFTLHLRYSIKALQSDEPIPFTDELKNVKAYMNIEKMRFGKNFKVEYNIECADFKVIPLAIQPLAENAARHGICAKGDVGGTITIHSFETEDSYVVEVIDDGCGFDVDSVLERDSDSIGLKNLIFRMKTLMNSKVEITSRIGFGTKAVVTIPKKGTGNNLD